MAGCQPGTEPGSYCLVSGRFSILGIYRASQRTATMIPTATLPIHNALCSLFLSDAACFFSSTNLAGDPRICTGKQSQRYSERPLCGLPRPGKKVSGNKTQQGARNNVQSIWYESISHPPAPGAPLADVACALPGRIHL